MRSRGRVKAPSVILEPPPKSSSPPGTDRLDKGVTGLYLHRYLQVTPAGCVVKRAPGVTPQTPAVGLQSNGRFFHPASDLCFGHRRHHGPCRLDLLFPASHLAISR